MDAVNTVIVGVLVSAAGVILGLMTTGLRHEFADFRKEIKAELLATEQRLDGRIDRLQTTLDGRIDRLQAEVGGIRSDLTQVALAVGIKPRASNG
jgi:hypothetical protein